MNIYTLFMREAQQTPRSLWDFGEFLHEYAKIPINGAPLGVCKV
jgi:hypothetical protein